MRELTETDKITQKMTRDGAVSENLATGEVEHISSREPETELSASSEESACLLYTLRAHETVLDLVCRLLLEKKKKKKKKKKKNTKKKKKNKQRYKINT